MRAVTAKRYADSGLPNFDGNRHGGGTREVGVYSRRPARAPPLGPEAGGVRGHPDLQSGSNGCARSPRRSRQDTRDLQASTRRGQSRPLKKQCAPALRPRQSGKRPQWIRTR